MNTAANAVRKNVLYLMIDRQETPGEKKNYYLSCGCIKKCSRFFNAQKFNAEKFNAQNKGGKVKMNKRIILKTVLVCLGIFLILVSAGIYFFTSSYELDTEKKYQVIIAAADIPVGVVINHEMVTYRTIKESGYNLHMVQKPGQVVGMKALAPIREGDYISGYDLLPPNNWYKDNDRTIILPMDVESRLANLI